jgi:hypothetical protein
MSTDHWVAFFPRFGDIRTTTQAINAAPDVKGVMRRYRMKDLYTLDQIDLDELKDYVTAVQALGKKVSIMVEDKTFDGTNPMPDHMKNLAVLTRNGYTALRWVDKVKAEYIKLICEIQKIPNLHSVSIMETALGIPDPVLVSNGYTPDRYSQMYIEYFNALNEARPGRPVFFYQNFFAKDGPGLFIDKTIAAVKDLGTLRLGGPDWWPTNKALVERVYPRYAKWKDQGVYTFIMMSTPSYAQWQDGNYNTPDEMLAGAQEELKVGNVFWCYTKIQPVEGAYDFLDATHLMHP